MSEPELAPMHDRSSEAQRLLDKVDATRENIWREASNDAVARAKEAQLREAGFLSDTVELWQFDPTAHSERMIAHAA